MAGRTTGNKRQREMVRKERQAQKITRRDERRAKVPTGDGIEWIDPVTGEPIPGVELPDGSETLDEATAQPDLAEPLDNAARAKEARPLDEAPPRKKASAEAAVPDTAPRVPQQSAK